MFLRAETTTDVITELDNRRLPIGEITTNQSVALSIGVEIPSHAVASST